MKQRVREYEDPVKERERLRAMVRNLPPVDVQKACSEILAIASTRLECMLPTSDTEDPKLYASRLKKHRECIMNLAKIAMHAGRAAASSEVQH